MKDGIKLLDMKISRETQARVTGFLLLFYGLFQFYYPPLQTSGIITLVAIIGGGYLLFTGKFIGDKEKSSRK